MPDIKHHTPYRLPLRLILLAAGVIFTVAYQIFPAAKEGTAQSVRFGMCDHGSGYDCVIDGDTFILEGTRIRVADIDAPETHPSRCAREANLGEEATAMLLRLLNDGPFTLSRYDDRDKDTYGRKLRVVKRGGRSLGGMLVDKGIARAWTGHRRPWCD